MMTKRNEKPTTLPELVEFHAIRDRRIELCRRADELAAELKTVNAALAKAGVSGERRFDQKPAQPPAPKLLSAKARELVGNIVKFTESEAPTAPKPDKTFDLIEKSKALSAERAAVLEAVQAIRPAEFDAMLTASQAVCEQRAEEYRTIANRLVTAAAELADALVEHDGFTISMSKMGLSWSFARPLPVLGLLDNNLLIRLAELVKAGNRYNHSAVEPSAIAKWTRHTRHTTEPLTRHNRPQRSQVRAGILSPFNKDAKAAIPLAARVSNPRMVTNQLRRK
jgi:hypothetical protein